MSAPETLLRRILREHRRTIAPLLAVLVIDVLAYGLLVYPLSSRVSNVTERTATSERALAAARRDYAQASGTLNGKSRAATELTTFYRDVLPADLTAARRQTFLSLNQLARDAHLHYVRGTNDTEQARGSTLARLKIEMELSGTYADIRAFIHRVETAPAFVVIDNVELAQASDSENVLTLKLELSTYYRAEAQ
ncbi:MAG TPA: type 4a pilus biogenesis protein PilO [Vicinamibacterales bacterium]|nr:type 4a pilus biogenesis protein PilO [Vicinamibacterales bacterium]